MPKASSTISSWIQDSFRKNKLTIQLGLSNAVSSIHLSFDLWTSPNNLSLMAIVVYWLNSEGLLCHALLGLRRSLGAHSGDNQGCVVWAIITEFRIQGSLGYFTLDNASNNTTALKFIQNHINQQSENILQQAASGSTPPMGGLQRSLHTLQPILSQITQPANTLFLYKSRYVRCYGHVLNLVVKVFLYVKKSVQHLSLEEKKNVERDNLEMEK